MNRASNLAEGKGRSKFLFYGNYAQILGLLVTLFSS
jgi:hypothetical protein